MSYLSKIENPDSVITPIPNGIPFPEKVNLAIDEYGDSITKFREMIFEVNSSNDLLRKIRSPNVFDKDVRMDMLKMFRRCVSLVCDTERTKKISAVSTDSLIENYGHTFKPITILRKEFGQLTEGQFAGLAVALSEYDDRGQQGYVLTGFFFDWFEGAFPQWSIEGPRGAGSDVELHSVFPDFIGDYPCDFVIRNEDEKVLAVGFARYDSTRGGAQSDDRTGGNESKVLRAKSYCRTSGNTFRLIFISDGPGLTHGDTWRAAYELDDSWSGNVRVATLKLCEERITRDWLLNSQSE